MGGGFGGGQGPRPEHGQSTPPPTGFENGTPPEGFAPGQPPEGFRPEPPPEGFGFGAPGAEGEPSTLFFMQDKVNFFSGITDEAN